MVPAGYRLALTVRGSDYDHGLGDSAYPGAGDKMQGVGPYLHNHPQDRPAEIFGGRNRLHFAAGKKPYLLLPVIPPQSAQ